MSSRHTLSCTSAAILIAVLAGAAFAAGEEIREEGRLPGEIAGAIADRRYGEAVGMIDGLLAGEREDADVLLYYKGLALLQAKQHEEALSALGEIEETHPKSAWAAKARFTRAKALVALRRFQEAEAIFEGEAKRLLSAERKRELAGVLIAIAKELAAPADPTKPEGRKPDYDRAYALYKAAIEMEIDRDLRDDCTFALGSVMQSAEQWDRAAGDFAAYLAAFDPEFEHWRGAVEEAGKPRHAAGKHVHQARLSLGGCQLKAGHRTEARRTFGDLLALVERIEKRSKEDEAIRARAMYETVHTYAIGEVQETLLAIKAARTFIEAYPSHDDAVSAGIGIADHFREIGRDDEAIAAYGDFLDGKDIAPEGEKAKEAYGRLKLEARFRLGQIHLARKEYDEAKAVFGDYIANHPNGPHWSRCQQGIIEADFRAGADLMREKEYETARAKWETFLAKYPLEGRNQAIMYNFGEMYRLQAEAIEDSEEEAEARREALHRSREPGAVHDRADV